MTLRVRGNRLHKALQTEAACQRRFGAQTARKIMQRLEALSAAESLSDFWPPKSGPERCHELKGNRAGVFSVDLNQPYRLLLEPYPRTSAQDMADEWQRWKSIQSIEIVAVEDTHG